MRLENYFTLFFAILTLITFNITLSLHEEVESLEVENASLKSELKTCKAYKVFFK